VEDLSKWDGECMPRGGVSVIGSGVSPLENFFLKIDAVCAIWRKLCIFKQNNSKVHCSHIATTAICLLLNVKLDCCPPGLKFMSDTHTIAHMLARRCHHYIVSK